MTKGGKKTMYRVTYNTKYGDKRSTQWYPRKSTARADKTRRDKNSVYKNVKIQSKKFKK